MPLVPPTQPPLKNVPRVLVSVLGRLALGRPSSLASLVDELFDGLTPEPVVTGLDQVPQADPFVLTFNHYESARVASWWGPLLIARLVHNRRSREPRDLRLLMAREWWYPSGWARYVKMPLTRLLFRRIARVYGLIPVPPVLEGAETRGQGVTGVRQTLALTRGTNPALVGLAPEGFGGQQGALREPPPGVGLFLLLLTHGMLPCLPVGWYDEAGRIVIRFGRPFMLQDTRRDDRRAQDRAAAARVMLAIRDLLPPHLAGPYAPGMRLAVPIESV